MSPDDLYHHLENVLRTRPYYPCALLVHVDVWRLEGGAQALAARAGQPHLAVSQTLTAALLDAPVAQRSTLATECLNRPLAVLRPGPVICTDLALLFEPSLELDPLVLLRQWSRSVPVVACWPGAFDSSALAYAVPAHAHYRVWRDPQLCAGCIINL